MRAWRMEAHTLFVCGCVRVCVSSRVMADWEQGLARWQRMPTRTQEADTQRQRGVSDAFEILAGTKAIHDIIANKPTSQIPNQTNTHTSTVHMSVLCVQVVVSVSIAWTSRHQSSQSSRDATTRRDRPHVHQTRNQDHTPASMYLLCVSSCPSPSGGLSVVSPRSNNNNKKRRHHRSDSPADSLIDRSVVGESAKALIARVPQPAKQPLCHIASTKPQPHRQAIVTQRPIIIKHPITIKPRTQQAQQQRQPAPHPHNKPAVIKAEPAADADAAVQRQSKKPSQPRPPINKNDNKKGRKDSKQHKQQEQPK